MRTGRASRWVFSLPLCVGLTVWSGACALARSANPPAKREAAHWVAPQPAPVGAVLLLHGLNNRPVVWDSWAKFLHAQGFSTLVPTLRGHLPSESLQGVDAKDWVEDVGAALQELQRRAPHQPRYVFCYSLGCAALLKALQQSYAAHLQGIVYFAPAFRLTPFAQLLRILTPLRHLGVAAPSFVPEPIRVHAFTPVQAYSSVFSLVDKVWPTTVRGVAFVAEGDELVSVCGLEEWFSDELVILNRAELRKGTPYSHLIVDPTALTPEAEQRVKREVLEFLRPRSPQRGR